MSKRRIYKIGDKVQSHFRARWKGLIIDLIDSDNSSGYYCAILIVVSSKGRKQTRKMISYLDPDWLTKCNFPDDFINPNWLSNTSDKI